MGRWGDAFREWVFLLMYELLLLDRNVEANVLITRVLSILKYTHVLRLANGSRSGSHRFRDSNPMS